MHFMQIRSHLAQGFLVAAFFEENKASGFN